MIKAWEMLGGQPLTGLSAYVDNHSEFEANSTYADIIEKKAEGLYRSISQRTASLPNSNNAVRTNILKTRKMDLTPQESEQLSKFVSDDGYVKKQKKDIEELTAKFKEMLGDNNDKNSDNSDEYIDEFVKNFFPENDFSATYVLIIPDIDKTLTIKVTPENVNCKYTNDTEGDVVMKVPVKVLKQVILGKMTFQKGFMAGDITAKGNFKTLRMLDQIFRFRYKR